MKREKTVSLIAVVAIVIIMSAVGVFLLFVSPPPLEIEVNPSPPLRVSQGETFSIDITIRIHPGVLALARHVRGELNLPEDFLEESQQARTRQLIFGSIWPGDASHYGLTIIVSDSIAFGIYHATFTIWGENLPITAIDIEITVVAS
ncbi:MAG: hypothetical protein ACXAC8_14405 [Candidatus Hodarchaeales archaeon]|jgi:hypothetical protein